VVSVECKVCSFRFRTKFWILLQCCSVAVQNTHPEKGGKNFYIIYIYIYNIGYFLGYARSGNLTATLQHCNTFRI